MSTTREGEGTLRVYPNILLPTAYVILRPFFQEVLPRSVFTSDEDYLDASNWALDLDSTVFPGSVPGNGQELSDVLHPHLDLQRCMTSLPLVEPGDLAFWHCDVIHAVEVGTVLLILIIILPLLKLIVLSRSLFIREKEIHPLCTFLRFP
jgi:hypothetical protein